MKQLDGGRLDGENMGRSEVIGNICEDLGMGGKSIKYAPISMIETLQEAAYQQTAEAAATQLPDAQEQALDEYPMPDPTPDPGRFGKVRLSGRGPSAPLQRTRL